MDITLAPMALLSPALAHLEHTFYPGSVFGFGVCPYGHQLRPGRVLIGWSPCGCTPALANRSGRGHRTVQCLDCSDYRISSIRYTPEHVGGGHSHGPSGWPPGGHP